MSEANAGVAYRVQQLGAEGVRARIREINDELRAGKPVTKDLRQEVRELGVQVGTQNRVVKLSSQAWMENHRVLQTSARIMSTVGSVARSALAVTSAWTLASIAFGRTNSTLMETRQELERTSAQLQDAMARGADQEEISGLQDKVNVLTASVKELEAQDTQGAITNFTNLGATIAIMGSSSITAASKFAPMIGKLKDVLPHSLAYSGALTNMSRGSLGLSLRTTNLLGNLGKVAGAAAGAGVGILGLTDQMDDLVESLTGQKSNQFNKAMINEATTIGGFAAGGAMVGGPFGAIAGGTIGALIETVKALNALHQSEESLKELKNIPKLADRFDKSNPRVKEALNSSTFASANRPSSGHITSRTRLYGIGGVISEPILGIGRSGQSYLFGERGNELVTPMGSVRSGGGSSGSGGNHVTINFNIRGDISGEELIDKVRKAIKDNLRGLGFTGMG